jgi:hypothetical protein
MPVVTGQLPQDLLANKPVAVTSACSDHCAQQVTPLTIHNVMSRWGVLIVPLGYTDRAFYGTGDNPYGVSDRTPRWLGS